jgi:uncharacterized cupredoxin-like copper-binding protein
MRRVLVVLITFGAIVVMAALPAGAGAGDVKKFCKANIALDAAFSVEQPKRRIVNGLLDVVARTAPPEIADAVDTAVPAFKENPEDAFEDPAVEEAVGEIEAFEYESCGYEQLSVTLQEYEFGGVPAEVKKGTTAFRLTNQGSEAHEFFVLRLKRGTSVDELAAADESEFDDLAQEIGGGFALPGDEGYATMNFRRPGRYAAVCFIPVGTTEAAEGTGPPHLTQGMVAEFKVT